MKIKTATEIKIMGKGGEIADFVMQEIAKNIRPGVSTIKIDKIASRIIKARGATASFLDYQNYPASICISLNKNIVHSIPSDEIINNGDVVKVDLGVLYKGFHTDMARSFIVGNVPKNIEEMVRLCLRALDLVILQVKPGNTIGDLEEIIGKTLKSGGLSPVMSLTGHGIGRDLHEKPSIYCDGKKSTKEKLVPGMVIAIEPMATMGSGKVVKGDDGWTIKSADDSMTAHFEDTVAVTKTGHKVLTRRRGPVKIFL